MKITDNLGEFQNFLDSDNKTGLCPEDTIKFFDIQRIFGKQAVREGSKNPNYDLLGNEKISWRTILYLFAKREKIEAVSKMHDHVTSRFIFGYKLLVCGYWDGGNFIPVDFSLHRERDGELDKVRAWP